MLDFINANPTLIYVLQIYTIVLLVISVKPVREKLFLLRFAGVTVFYLLAGIFLPDLTLAHFLYIPFIVMFALTILCIYCISNVNIKELFFMALSAFLIQFTAECATFLIRCFFFLEADAWLWVCVSFIAYFVVYVLYYLFYIRRIRAVEIKAWKTIAVSIVIFVVIFSVYNGFMYEYRNGLPFRVPVFYFIYAVVCTVALSLVLFLSNRSDRAAVEQQVMKNLLRQEQLHYEKLVVQQDAINRKCHDLKYQISVLKGTAQSKEGEAYIDQLEQDVLFYERIAKTGNVALDYVLSEKYLYCVQNQIQFTYMVDGNVLDKIDTLDIYSLFGNAIDNAIECVSRYPDPEKRIISLQAMKTGALLRIHFENYCEENPFDKDGALITQKEDRSVHGFGVKSIRYIVEKYKGYVSFHYEPPFFNLDIMIPI